MKLRSEDGDRSIELIWTIHQGTTRIEPLSQVTHVFQKKNCMQEYVIDFQHLHVQ